MAGHCARFGSTYTNGRSLSFREWREMIRQVTSSSDQGIPDRWVSDAIAGRAKTVAQSLCGFAQTTPFGACCFLFSLWNVFNWKCPTSQGAIFGVVWPEPHSWQLNSFGRHCFWANEGISEKQNSLSSAVNANVFSSNLYTTASYS